MGGAVINIRQLSLPPLSGDLCAGRFHYPSLPSLRCSTRVFFFLFPLPALSVLPHSFGRSRICLSSTKFLFSLFFSPSCYFCLVLFMVDPLTSVVPSLPTTDMFIARLIYPPWGARWVASFRILRSRQAWIPLTHSFLFLTSLVSFSH